MKKDMKFIIGKTVSNITMVAFALMFVFAVFCAVAGVACGPTTLCITIIISACVGVGMSYGVKIMCDSMTETDENLSEKD